MKREKKISKRILISAAVLLILAILAAGKAAGMLKEEAGDPAAAQEQSTDALEAAPDAQTEEQRPEEQPDAGTEQEALNGQENGGSEETAGGDGGLTEEEQKAAFLPDYTSAPLLNTTVIRDLSMEVGTSETELRFNWLSPSARKGQVRLTDTESGETKVFDADCSASATVPGYYVNKASADGLTPGASYRYQVGNEEGWSPEYTYRCPEENLDSLTFLVTADAQIGQSDMEDPSVTAERWDSVLTRLAAYVPEASFLFHLGDQVADFGSEEHYGLFLDHLALYSMPLAPAVGNHDVANETSIEENGHPGGPYFYEHFNVPNRSAVGQSQYGQDGNYYFIRGNVLFIVLNSSTSQGSEAQEQYVAQIVAEHPDTKWRVLAQHYPAYPGAERSHTDCKEYLARIADANDIDLILGAHDHVYSRTAFVNGLCETLNDYPYSSGSVVSNPEGTLYITCSTSSGCLYHEPDSEIRIVKQGQPYTPMALRFDVTDTELRLRAYLVDSWTVYDEYTIRKE